MVDILAIGAHPDDCELSMGGTLALLKAKKYRVGVCDLSMGESGTYGSEITRQQELSKASEILQLDLRVTLDIPDGNIWNTEKNRLKLIEVIRKHKPRLIFSFITDTRHPDHRYTAELVKDCIFLSGLEKIKSSSAPFRPAALLRFPELFLWNRPDLVVDISDYWEQKMAAIKAFSSQVNLPEPGSRQPPVKTFVKSKEFLELIEARSKLAGGMIGVKYGEPFYSDRPLLVSDPFVVTPKEFR